jgi:hypothetical protein
VIAWPWPEGTWVRGPAALQAGVFLGPHWPRPLKQIDFSKVFWERDRPEWLVLESGCYGAMARIVSLEGDLPRYGWRPLRAQQPSVNNPDWIKPGMELSDEGGERLVVSEIRGTWALIKFVESTEGERQEYGLWRVRDLPELFKFQLNRLERAAFLHEHPL